MPISLMRTLHLHVASVAAVAVIGAAAPVARLDAQSTTLSLGASFDPSELLAAGPFGKAADPTQASVAIGQTFMRPVGSTCALTCYLQGFSFQLGNDPGFTTSAASLKFRAYIATWDGTKAGAVLYSSGIFDGPTLASQAYMFASPGIAIATGTQYVAFLSAVGLFGTIGVPDATALMETVLGANHEYAGGAFVYTNTGTTLANLSSTAWDYTGDSQWQTRFTATFATSVVPEPSSMVLFAVGGAMLVFLVRRTRNAQTRR